MRSDETEITDPATERLLDVMLFEALGGSKRPDLSKQIFAMLDADQTPTIRLSEASESRSISWLSVVLAATFLLIIGGTSWKIYSNHDSASSSQIAEQKPALPSIEEIESSKSIASSVSSESDLAVVTDVRDDERPSEDFDINMQDLPFGVAANGRASSKPMDDVSVDSSSERLASKQIVSELDHFIQDAWERLDIAPSMAVSDEEVAVRLENVLAGSGAATEHAVNSDFSLTTVATEYLGKRWGEHLYGRDAWNRLSKSQRNEVIEQLASCFRGETAFDSVVVAMLIAEGSSEPEDADFNPAAVWLSELSDGKSISVTNQFCDVVLDMDVSCGRCHTHPLERNLAQQNYWDLNAVFETDPKHGKPKKIVFYESSDGRQLVANPSISSQWFGSDEEFSSVDRKKLASIVENSDQLARATINGLWNLVFGNRLVGRMSDPLAPPSDKSFVAARDMLAKQLRMHDYDLGAAISWIVASKPMKVGRATSRMDQGSLVVSNSELEQMEMRKRAFAAFTDRDSDWSFSELVAAAEKFNRGLALSNNVLLAQPTGIPKDSGSGSGVPAKMEQRHQALMRSFPHQASEQGLPAGWLARLGDSGGYEQQARHLFYVAGYSDSVIKKQLDAANRIRGSAINDEAALNQLWWAIRLSKNVL